VTVNCFTSFSHCAATRHFFVAHNHLFCPASACNLLGFSCSFSSLQGWGIWNKRVFWMLFWIVSLVYCSEGGLAQQGGQHNFWQLCGL
jgi:hypothetical protein